MTTPTTTYHPRWCRQEQCTDTAHRGRLTTIRTVDGSHAAVAVQLIQPRTPGAAASIAVAGDAGVVVLSLRQAKALSYTMRGQLRAAERIQR